MCANSSLPVLQNRNPNGPMSLLTHSLGGLNLGGVLNTTEGESPLNSSSSHSQSVTSDSTLMTLASLISMSPALASLALPFAGQSVTSNNSNTDFAAGAAAAISPGFLTALAQYLNVQPHNSGHQSVSPMQQLAETAQLAAQLAAMVGAHSPDQTPMQPAQALALAQLVMSQATSSLSEPPWATLSKRDVAAADQAHDAGVSNSLNRHVDKDASDDLMRSRMHLTHDPAGILTTGDESCLESQSPWSLGFGITGTSNRVSPRAVEGRAPGKSASDSLTRNESGAERPRGGTLRSGGTVFSTSRSQTKGQPKVGSQRSPTSLTSSKAPNGFPSSSTRDTVKSSCSTEGITHNTMVQNSTTTANPVWPWPVESDMADGKRKADQVVSGDRGASQRSSPSQKNPTNQWINKIKQTPTKSDAVVGARGTSGNSDTRATNSSPLVSGKRSNRAVTSQSKPAPQTVSKNGTVLFPPKVTGTTPTNKNKVAHARNTTVSTTATSVAPQSMPSRVANSVVSDPEATADHELEQLIQWCQTRLGSLPMREKVDIPTVVELLATLDAPYEVERMVQTFLGESARTSQFVKDFLDHRRPFWQLHRERRERESQIKSSSKSQSGGNHAQSNGPRAAEKKKKSHAQEGTGRVNSSTGCNGGLGWHKVGSSTSDNHTDPTQDNEWHHIKPKSNHNRRGKKDKAS
ncbi:hypothetical protein FGIG_07908 [Fasciola gigantica]|uniref:PERQ amino acid-rich with GYF domain-containing protein 2 n=1 Tax=Fasciola gigantica TaxID=46835 RepID=A0A504ZBN8_FASGI|nr:hypothetical protein FGIG_07908 [Fasciola gigantica]